MSESTGSVRYVLCGNSPWTPPQLKPCVTNTCPPMPCATKGAGSGKSSTPDGSWTGPSSAGGPSYAAGTASYSPVRYANGSVLLQKLDISVPGGGDFFSHVRFYCNQASPPFAGPAGNNWWVGSMPTIVQSSTGLSVAVTFDPNNPYWFDISGSDYIPRYGVVGVTLVEDTSAHTLTFTQTVNGMLEVTVFNDFTVWPNPGGFVSHKDSQDITSTADFAIDGTCSQLQRSFTLGGTTTTETLLYAYYQSGSSLGQLQTVMLQRTIGSGSPTPVQQVTYAYYGASDPNGNLNDLQSVTQQLPDGMGGWNTVAVEYYRYWLGTESTGIAHGLKMHFGPEAYRLRFNLGIDLTSAADSVVLPYADHYFEYNPTSGPYYGFVTKEIAAVCPGCPGGGTTQDLFGYTATTSTTTPGYNVWAMKTVQTLPDGSKIIVYSNYAGMPMLKASVDPAGTTIEITAYIYNADGLLIWVCSPAAVNGYDDSYDDLLNFNTGTGLYAYINTSAGLIDVTDYYTSTGSGAVLDYVENVKVRQGQSGSDIPVRSFTYTSNVDSDGNAVYPIATQIEYPNDADPTITITTSFAYAFYSGTNIISQKTTTVPVISTGQNGSGDTYTIVENFDVYGNLTSNEDEREVVNHFTFAGPLMGKVTQQVLNYQSGVTAPGVNVTSNLTYDDLGELTLTLGPSHTVVLSGTATTVRSATYGVYIQSIQPSPGTIWGPDQNLTANGYAAGTGPSYTYAVENPVSITNLDKDGRTLDNITSVRTTGSGALSPTDTFAQTDWQTWTNVQYDNQHRNTGNSVYFLIPASGTGLVGVNFKQTTYGYDALERKNKNVAPGKTITRTVWTTPQRIASVWVGTNDNGATDSDPTGGGAAGNNMVMVKSNQYDGGSAYGNGNLTRITRYVSGTSGDTRVTAIGYDFRNRQISMTDATGRYYVVTIDNLGRITQVQGYSSVGGTLFAQKQAKFDDRGQTYQTLTFAVNISTGAVGNALIGNKWFDPSGNVLQSIGEGEGKSFAKQTYNGVNWVLSAYRGYNTSGVSYAQASTVSGDIIVEQADNTYDEAGNSISTAISQRLNDAPTTESGSTGALSYGTSPKARVSHVAGWFDGIDRSFATANYGAIASFTRPDTPPSSSATVLVNLTGYDDAGRPYESTDAMGKVNQKDFDNSNRTVTTIEDVAGLARTTNFTWTLDDKPSSMTAVNADTGDQTTFWIYGTTLAESGVCRNDLVRAIAYPGAVLSWATLTSNTWASLDVDQWASLPVGPDDEHVTQFTYNRLGEKNTFTDQRGTTRAFTRDLLGRETDDGVVTLGTDTDGTILRISRTFDIRGLVSTITSADNATPGAGTILNQVGFLYNDFAQLITDNQSHSGAVGGGTPNVQYGFDSGGSSSNEIRLNQLTYPNGRTIAPSYGTSGGMSDYLNRLDAINDTTSSTSTLAQYLYLGARTPIRLTYPDPGIWLDLWGGTSGSFAGLDLFSRIIDQRWQNDITGTPTDIDRYKYGYDLNSNRLWKNNVVGTAAVTAGLDEFYGYDDINRLSAMQRGVLNGANTGITGTPSVEQDWTLDPTGNWANFVTNASGTATLNQTRTANTVNEITNVTETTGPTWIVPGYDAAGNTITMPQVVDPTQSFTAVYDAWNRMVSISAGSDLVGVYQYDGRGFRIVKLTFTGGTLSETRRFFYTANWQNIEERVGTSTSMDKQYVWGIRFIDELICRDNATPQRLYAMQDANFNLTCIADISGVPLERYLFNPYGDRTVMNAGWSVISGTAYDWMISHQALIQDIESGLMSARSRVRNPMTGAFSQREPFGALYVDTYNLYEVCRSNVINRVDPVGLDAPPDWSKQVPNKCGCRAQNLQQYVDESWNRMQYYDKMLNAYQPQVLAAQNILDDLTIASLKQDFGVDNQLLRQEYATLLTEQAGARKVLSHAAMIKHDRDYWRSMYRMFSKCEASNTFGARVLTGLDKPPELALMAIANVTGQIGATVSEVFIGPVQIGDDLTGNNLFGGTELQNRTMWGLTQDAMNEGWKAIWDD